MILFYDNIDTKKYNEIISNIYANSINLMISELEKIKNICLKK